MIKFSIKNTVKVFITTTLVFLLESHSVNAQFHINESQAKQANNSILTDFTHKNDMESEPVNLYVSDLDSVKQLYITNEKGDSSILVSGNSNKNHPEIILSGKGFVINAIQIPVKTEQNLNIQNSKENTLSSQTKNTRLNFNFAISKNIDDVYLDLLIKYTAHNPLTKPATDTTNAIKLYLNNGVFTLSTILSSAESNWISINKYTNPLLYTSIFDKYYTLVQNKVENIHHRL